MVNVDCLRALENYSNRPEEMPAWVVYAGSIIAVPVLLIGAWLVIVALS